MTLKFTTQHGLPTGPMKKSVSIMVLEGNGYAIPALTLHAVNPDFPISDLNDLAAILVSQFNNKPPPVRLDAGDYHLHYAQAENGVELRNGYNLVFRTPKSGVTASEGVFVSIDESLPSNIETEIRSRFPQVIRDTLDAVDMGMQRGMTPISQPPSGPTFQA